MERFFRRHFAVGQKLGESGPYGQGFNYHLEVRFPLSLDRDICLKAMSAVVATLDHKALGVDVHIPAPPSSENLARYLALEIEKRVGTKVSLSLERGDGFLFREF